MRKGILFCFLVLMSFGLRAQAPDFAWAQKGQGFTSGIAIDGNGNSYVINSFVDTVDIGSSTFISKGYKDLLVAKYDASGNLLWVQQYGGAGHENGYEIAADKSGNFYVTGDFTSSVTFGDTTLTAQYGSIDGYVFKGDSQGTVLWASQMGADFQQRGIDVAADDNGNCYVVGGFDSSTLTLGDTTFTRSGMDDVFLVKYDSSGNVLWARKAGGADRDEARGVALDGNGNCFITGNFRYNSVFGPITLVNNACFQVFLAKYDSSGTILWAQSAGGLQNDLGFSIAADADGNTYLSGRFYFTAIFGNFTVTSNGDADMFFAKYDPSGTALWARGVGGPGFDTSYDIAAGADGSCYSVGVFLDTVVVAGHTLSPGYDGSSFLIKYDASGAEMWIKQPGGWGMAKSHELVVDRFGNSYLTGRFNGQTIFGNSTLTSTYNRYYYFVAKLQADHLIDSPVPQSSYCAGSSISLPFTAIGTYSTGNIFSAQLSDASGSFSSPVTIGSLTDTIAGTINAVIPSGTPADSGYRIRVVASAPSVTGLDNGTDLTIHALPVVTAAVSSAAVCQGASTTLTASGAATYVWSNGQTGSSIVVTPSVSTTYTVTGTSAQGCSVTDSVTVSVLILPVTPAFSAFASCEGESVQFAAFTDSTVTAYSWSGPGGFTSTLQNPIIPNATPAHNGTYTLTVTNAAGCSSQSSLPVTVKPLPDSTFTVSGSGNAFTFTANGTGSYDWTFPGGTPATSTAQSVTVTYAGQGSFPVSLFTTGLNQCGAGSSQTITILGTAEIATFKASLYPNPTDGLLIVELAAPATEQIRLQVFNVLGQEMSAGAFLPGASNLMLDLSALPTGRYQLRLQSTSGVQYRALVVQK